ncbi:MAG: Ni/Fe-hydrogenase, b-type cytochrome subunit [Rhodobacteraceae bacterium HLUCCA08]|nr:MAG: Ni/Fe-hydrogenase, b-type cytochrome subunit [Rhodobacteraceae bacterium HLUCCA08]
MSDADLDTALKGAHADPEDLASAARQTSVYVYEAPVRIWHWINAAAILVLCVTGYLIGAPPPSMQIAEATHQFVFGFIRFAHFAAGWILAIGFLGRIYWAIFGNHHARQLFILPLWKRDFWREIWFEVKWYLFLEKEPKKYVGHNPLAQLAMFGFITLGVSFMIVTGLALYSEGLGVDSTLYALFGWVFTLLGPNPHVVHTLHHLGMWWIVIFMIVHIYVAIREDIMSRQSIVSTMISGHRTFKDDRPD